MNPYFLTCELAKVTLKLSKFQILDQIVQIKITTNYGEALIDRSICGVGGGKPNTVEIEFAI